MPVPLVVAGAAVCCGAAVAGGADSQDEEETHEQLKQQSQEAGNDAHNNLEEGVELERITSIDTEEKGRRKRYHTRMIQSSRTVTFDSAHHLHHSHHNNNSSTTSPRSSLRRGPHSGWNSSNQLHHIERIASNDLPNEDRWMGYLDGDFSTGRVRDIVLKSGCYPIAFSPDAAILAIGMNKGEGVALYECHNFSLVLTIERNGTVSALCWVKQMIIAQSSSEANDFSNDIALDSSILAVGGFDGVFSIYHITPALLEIRGVTLLCEVQLASEVRSLAIATRFGSGVGQPSYLVSIGEKNGNLSLLSLPEICTDHSSLVGKHKLTRVKTCESAILGIAMNHSGTLLATGQKDGTATVNRIMFETNNGLQATLGDRVFEAHRNGAIRCVAFSKDDSRLVMGGYDKVVAIVDTRVWAITRELTAGGTVNNIVFDPHSRYLAVGSRDKSFTVYDTSTFHPIKTTLTPGWVTCISWGETGQDEDLLAVRSSNKLISIFDITSIRPLKKKLSSEKAMVSSLSWSFYGRFLARTDSRMVLISDALDNFRDVAKILRKDTVHCISFCHAKGKRDLLAVVGLDGILSVHQLLQSGRQHSMRTVSSTFVEDNLWVVSWSPDGSFLVLGGRGKNLHLLRTPDLKQKCPPIAMKSRIWAVDFMSETALEAGGERAAATAMAVGTGDYLATLFDTRTFQPTLQVVRSRTVRSLHFHPKIPLLAIGDGANHVSIIDTVNEETANECTFGGRVNSVRYSPCGKFLATGSDDCAFRLCEASTLKVLQEINIDSFALCVSFSGQSGLYMALGSASDNVTLVRLGPFLGTRFIPLAFDALPQWAHDDALYRSGLGPSLVQRYMEDGGQENLQRAALILKEHPDALYTYDRTTGEDCFDTALKLGKPSLLKLVLTTVVDGTLEAQTDGKRSIMTTNLPLKGRETLYEMITNHPSQFIVDVFKEMTFLKVPFTEAHVCSTSETKECGNSSFTDPWYASTGTERSLHRSENKKAMDTSIKRGDVYRIPAVLPLPGLGSLDFLSALTRGAPPTVFDNEAMGIVLRVMWKRVRRYFFVDIVAFLLFFTLWVLLVDWTSASTSTPSDLDEVSLVALLFSVFLLNTAFAVKEVLQANFFKRKDHFESVWNVFDVLTMFLVYGYILHVFIKGAGSGSILLAVVTTLCLTAKLLAYLRGFDSTGWLISVLMQNFYDIRGFVVILAAILMGFAVSFRALFGDVQGSCELELEENELVGECMQHPYGTLPRSFLSTFELSILGSYEPEMLYESQETVVAIITFILAVTVVLVVALNALIAVLSDSFSRVQENAVANRRRERADLIVEYLSLLPTRHRKRIEESTHYFHALLEADADGDLLVHKDDWEGGLNALRRDIAEMSEENEEFMSKSLEKMRSEVNTELTSLSREISSKLEQLSEDIKDLKRMQREGGITLKGRNVTKAVNAVKSIGKKGEAFWHNLEKGDGS